MNKYTLAATFSLIMPYLFYLAPPFAFVQWLLVLMSVTILGIETPLIGFFILWFSESVLIFVVIIYFWNKKSHRFKV